MISKLKKYWKSIVISILLLVALYVIQHHLPWTNRLVSKINPLACEKDYQFVNAEIACGPPAVISKVDYKETQVELTELIGQKISNNEIEFTGLYFRDLERGPAFGINDSAEFAPASLLKLPTALAFLGAYEDQPEVFEKKLSYTWLPVSGSPYFPPKDPVKPGAEYSIDDLLRRMLAGSDNRSYIMLLDYLDAQNNRQVIEETLIDFGLLSPKNPGGDVLTVRRYASIFRALYNVSYLDADTNEKVLSWLKDAEFAGGLKAGVPSDVPVASKIGQRIAELDKTIHLHDCGIVYYPGNPYLLCVMTKGENIDELSETIGEISKVIYDEVDSRRLDKNAQP